MIVAVVYDPATGRILHTATASAAALDAGPWPYIAVDEFRFDYDATHMVIDGQLVEREG